MKRTIFCFITCTITVVSACWSMPEPSRGSEKVVAGNPSPASKASPSAEITQIPSSNSNMSDNLSGDVFYKSLPSGFQAPTDDAGKLLLREYGAVFVARGGAVPPKRVVYKDEAEVKAFQETLQSVVETIGSYKVVLQAPAMTALKSAIAQAKAAGKNITPRGADSARRGYTETVSLWKSRVDPGFVHWVGVGKVTGSEAARIKALSPYEQVPEILKLEKQGIYFAKDLSKSIIYSVAPPGTSQHLSMLALDVQQNDDPQVREILAKNGWYQTVTSDLPHFTFLGVPESELPSLGLKKKQSAGRTFWVPDI